MRTVAINGHELLSIELIRLALSETTPDLREKAIVNAKQEMVSLRIQALNDQFGTSWVSEPQNTELVRWLTRTTAERNEAIYELSQTGRRFEEVNQRKLNIAEHIGKRIWCSIQDGRFEGVQTDEGILKQVRYEAQANNVSGAKDMDTLRKTWKTYRGIVHLGMAMDYCEEFPELEENILFLAENFRRGLSEFCPKGTKNPYVPEGEQINFAYVSIVSGPRFRNRGLPFGTN